MGGKSVRKIETGLECGQPLLRKLIITATPSRQAQGCIRYLYLGNHRPHSSPVSIFRTDLAPLINGKGRKHSAAQIRDGEFERGSPPLMLCMGTVFLKYLGNH